MHTHACTCTYIVHTHTQQFGIQLAAHIINQSPRPEVLPIAEDIFKRLVILTNEIPDHMRETYFLPLLPSVVLLCQTFPPLCSEATKFLVGLSRACTARSVGEGVWSGNSPAHGQCSLAAAVKRTFDELINCAVVKAWLQLINCTNLQFSLYKNQLFWISDDAYCGLISKSQINNNLICLV